MVKIDIRDAQSIVNEIVFADEESLCFNSVHLTTGGYLQFTDSDGAYVITNKNNIENLIKALQKAVELGWTK